MTKVSRWAWPDRWKRGRRAVGERQRDALRRYLRRAWNYAFAVYGGVRRTRPDLPPAPPPVAPPPRPTPDGVAERVVRACRAVEVGLDRVDRIRERASTTRRVSANLLVDSHDAAVEVIARCSALAFSHDIRLTDRAEDPDALLKYPGGPLSED